MKNSKFRLSIIAIVFGLTAAFGFAVPTHKAFSNPYWAYNGVGDPTQPSSYTKLSGMPSCAGSSEVCAIEAPADGSEPVISSGLKTRIQTLNTGDGDVFLQD